MSSIMKLYRRKVDCFYLFMNYEIGTWANLDVSVYSFSFSLVTSQSKGVSGVEETWVCEGNLSRLSEESRLGL